MSRFHFPSLITCCQDLLFELLQILHRRVSDLGTRFHINLLKGKQKIGPRATATKQGNEMTLLPLLGSTKELLLPRAVVTQQIICGNHGP